MTRSSISRQTQQWERATEIAQRDHLHPVPSICPETGEQIWLVQSRSDPNRIYALTVEGETIICPCAHYQHRRMCTHAAAVRLALQAKRPPAPAAPSTLAPVRPSPTRSARTPEQRRAEARRQREEAARRERALLWTDDRPFSLFKE